MILFELTQNEQHPAYQALSISNGLRHYDFLKSLVEASLAMGRPFLSQQIIKALNYHAIACLHTNAGEYRPCQVFVGDHIPPAHHRVPALMDDFINMVNRVWEQTDAVVLATYVLWRLNNIHPFINGNGRSARAACYYVICVKSGGWLQGDPILPELIKRDPRYQGALKVADASGSIESPNLGPLHQLIVELLDEQLKVNPSASPTLPAM